MVDVARTNAPGPDWRHRLVAAYLAARHHRFKTTAANALRSLLRVKEVYYQAPSGARYLLNPRDYLQDQMLRYGASEPATMAAMARLLRPGAVVVDVGGHIGQYAIEAAMVVGDNGLVISFEPNPKTFGYLQRNIGLNGLRNTFPILAAASDGPHLIEMMNPPETNWGMSQTKQSADARGDYWVPGVRICDVLTSFNVTSVDLLKMDVEGAELEALAGLFCGCRIRPANLIFEFVPKAFKYGQKLPDFVRANGYEIFTITGDAYGGEDEVPECNLWARRKEACVL